ncbi:MAG: CRISPR-associated protein Cas4 [Candidatus Eremiobacteraeota bacterium]|nr:CRISPR-associated protein Cas4 [Candidatus Eremiobacteraeota bacterium]
MEAARPESMPMITPSEVIEHVYCPRFTYFMNCLNIPQHEELRYKVLKGRTLHEHRERENTSYLRKKIHCTGREISVYLASPALRVRGKVDEVLFFDDGSAGPLDYKYSEYNDYTFKTHKVQSVLYAMLIREIYRKPVHHGFICYTRGGSKVSEIVYSEGDFRNTKGILDEIFEIITSGYYPKRTSSTSRCADCCYKNICV